MYITKVVTRPHENWKCLFIENNDSEISSHTKSSVFYMNRDKIQSRYSMALGQVFPLGVLQTRRFLCM